MVTSRQICLYTIQVIGESRIWNSDLCGGTASLFDHLAVVVEVIFEPFVNGAPLYYMKTASVERHQLSCQYYATLGQNLPYRGWV